MSNNQAVWARDLPLMLKQVYKIYRIEPPKKPDLMLIDLVEWLQRIPEKRARQVFYSGALNNQIKTPLEIQSCDNLAHLLVTGQSVFPYLGATTQSIRNRSKSKKSRSPSRDDFHSAWGLLHFHLAPDIENKGVKSLRSRRVLIAYLSDDSAYFLKIVDHYGYQGDLHFLEILHNQWPNVLENYKLKGIKPAPKENRFTPEETVRLRAAGANTTITLGEDTFIGLLSGVTNDGGTVKAVKTSSDIRWVLNEVEAIAKNNGIFMETSNFCVHQEGGIGYFANDLKSCSLLLNVFEHQSHMAWFFRRVLSEVIKFPYGADVSVWCAKGFR